MSFLFILFVIFAIVTAILAVLWRTTRHNKGDYDAIHIPGFVPVIGSVLAFIVLVFCCTTIVGTRDVGIVTSFGRPVGYLDNGLHFKAPWNKVASLDGAIQTDNYTGKDCTNIRIGNESTACVDNTIQWRIQPNAADELYRDYKSMDHIRDSLVTRELKASLNQVLANYNPLTQISNDSVNNAKPDLNKFSDEVTKDLQAQIGTQIDVIKVIIPIINFDASTQAKINAYQAEIANTRIAQQSEQTAEAQAKAARNLSQAVSNNPNVLVSKCMDTMEEMVKASQPIPAGFSCWPGGNSAVVVPSASAK